MENHHLLGEQIGWGNAVVATNKKQDSKVNCPKRVINDVSVFWGVTIMGLQGNFMGLILGLIGWETKRFCRICKDKIRLDKHQI